MNNETLECGHPAACQKECGHGETWCEWCEELRILGREVEALKSVIKEKAVVVKDGGKLTIRGSVGCLYMEGGVVHFETLTATTIENGRAF